MNNSKGLNLLSTNIYVVHTGQFSRDAIQEEIKKRSVDKFKNLLHSTRDASLIFMCVR